MNDMLDFPALLDRHEADIDAAIADDNEACVRVACRLIRQAVAWIYQATEVGNWLLGAGYAADAADALHAAGKLAPEPHHTDLLRMSARLREALDTSSGVLTSPEFDAVSDDAEQVLVVLLRSIEP